MSKRLGGILGKKLPIGIQTFVKIREYDCATTSTRQLLSWVCSTRARTTC